MKLDSPDNHRFLGGDEDDFLEDKHLMELFRVSKQTLSNWRKFRGLPFFKFGRIVFYRKSNVKEWIENCNGAA